MKKFIFRLAISLITLYGIGYGNVIHKKFALPKSFLSPTYTLDEMQYPPLHSEKRDSLNISFVTRVLNGVPFSVFVKDTFAYYSEGGSFIILNIKDSTNPVFVGKLNTPTSIYQIYVSGDYAYLANWDFGLAIVDVSNPANPIEVGRYADITFIVDVFVVDTIAYITDYHGGKLKILNVKNPSSITKIGEWGTFGSNYPVYVYISDTLAYITDDGIEGLAIVNVKNPSTPTTVGQCQLGPDMRGFCISDTLAYVACGEDRLIKVVNISDPTTPTVVSECRTSSYATNIVIYDTFAYVGELTIYEGATPQYGRLEVINAANPESLFVVAQDTTINDIHDIQVYGNKLYVASYISRYSPFPQGLHILDLTTPMVPTKIGNYNTGGEAYDVVADGNYLYVAHGLAGVKVLDITNPATPTEIATCSTGFALSLDIEDTFLYVSDGVSVLITNIVNPNAPQVIGSFTDTTAFISDIDVKDTLAYFLDANNMKFRILNVSNPGSITEVGSLSLPGAQFPCAIKVVGVYAYIIDLIRGLRIINISDPTNPQITGTLGMRSYPLGIYIQGRHAYIPTIQGGFKIINISNPNQPIQEGSLGGDYYDGSIFVKDTLAFVAGFMYGLQIINVRDVSSPTRVGYYTITLSDIQVFRGICIKDSCIYLPDQYSGVWVFQSPLLFGVEEAKEKTSKIIDCLPNPFYTNIRIHYYVGKKAPISINVYDITGRLIRNLVNEIQYEGSYKILWDGKDDYGKRVSKGIYFIRMKTIDKELTHKLVFVK